jgi:UDP-N-acetylglucosamine pyrophosphorylase/galactokinase/mevalonate kinase-like predicted kinase
MSNELIETILSRDESIRNRSITSLLSGRNLDELLRFADELELFRLSSDNLYHKVRAALFLYVIYRFHLENNERVVQIGTMPFNGITAAFERDFEKAISIFLNKIRKNGSGNSALFSALADSYYQLSFQYLLDQVKLSISQCRENYHFYNVSKLNDYPFSVPRELTTPDDTTGRYPVGMDASPVRLDPSHSGWSDIFFLGMDFPEGARVVNLSVNLRIFGTDDEILPPCECYCRFIEEPVIHLVSVDLQTSKKISTLRELFNFGNDYLSLLKAGVVASGIVPPSYEHKDITMQQILSKLLNKRGGIEIVTRVNGIPKGSRLAVSTTLLAAIIARLMRFSGQIQRQTGSLDETERRVVASRAILGEWLGGSGGGWQDSGGLWPGLKVITGKLAAKEDPEYGVSRGCLLPDHHVFPQDEITGEIQAKILDSMVLVHGGISQDVGPVLEMVTGKYLLKYEKEWKARITGIGLFDEIVHALKTGNMKELGRLTTEDWETSIQHVIPWVNNAYTDALINKVKNEFKDDYWGFLMLGGMSGGGMAFIVEPSIRDAFKRRVAVIMSELRETYRYSFPFIVDPVVYDFDFNHDGIVANLLTGEKAVMPVISSPEINKRKSTKREVSEDEIKNMYGFDRSSHAHMTDLLKKGEIGLAQNRMPSSMSVEDVPEYNVYHFENETADNELYRIGSTSLNNNEIAVVSFAGGMGSRWTHGAAVVKPINPFVRIGDNFRTFIEMHLAKSARTGEIYGHRVPHVFTTSYLTHDAIRTYLNNFNYFGYKDKLYLSPAKSIAHRVYPMERDLRFYWEQQLQQKMDENIQKVQDSHRSALIEWSKSKGEGEDYRENNPVLRFNPPGHWYEIPNLLKNGVLATMIQDHPDLKYLLCHNIDTLGVHIDPDLLGLHIKNGSCLTYEVTPRRIKDAGGGLAKINGHVQLVEGLALPCDEDEYRLSYYNTLTNWVNIDLLLEYFGLNRELLLEAELNPEQKEKIYESIRTIEKKIPTYVTIKNVKHLWGGGQEDVYPVAQFEKLWGDMTGLYDLTVSYVSVSRNRGMQLKEPSLLDSWANDGSLDYVREKCTF